MNFIQSKMSKLFNHHLYCVHTSTLIAYLHNKKCSETNHSNKKCGFYLSCFTIGKIVQYFLVLAPALKSFYVGYYLKQIESREINFKTSPDYYVNSFRFNPLLISMLINFKLFNATVLQCSALLAVMTLYLDHLFFFRLDFRMVKAAHELIVENGRRFRVLNSENNFIVLSSESSYKRCQFWYRALVDRIWTKHSRLPRFDKPTLQCFPHLSAPLRVKLAVYSVILETFTSVTSITIGKFFKMFLPIK